MSVLKGYRDQLGNQCSNQDRSNTDYRICNYN